VAVDIQGDGDGGVSQALADLWVPESRP
jgi:hypothetical protein